MSPADWHVPDRPGRELRAGPITLRGYCGDETGALQRLVAENTGHLRQWMPWAPGGAVPTVAERRAMAEFVRRATAEWEGSREFDYWLEEVSTGDMVGGAGLRARIGPGALEIGYWVSASRVRRGYATAAARALTSAALGVPGVQRVEIHCDEANVASAGVPRRLGYRMTRIEARPAEAPGESGRHMVWVVGAESWVQTPGGVTASS